MNRVEITVNPKVLQWAREEAGFELLEIAEKLDVGADRFKLWEKEGKNIPLGKLRDLANSYKRQLAVFLLPEVPDKVNKPKDFRNLKPSESKLSRKTIEVIRDVTYFRQTALELQGEEYWQNRYAWISKARQEFSDSEKFNLNLRELLNITVEDQLNWHSDSEAYRNWRRAVEDYLGIFVFQFSMPLTEVQGFCLTDFFPHAIVTNSNQSYTARIFTIFHEIAHIVRNQSGMCLFEKATEKQKEEWACNRFAGNFLIPKDFVESSDDLKTIYRNASKLRVSREAYLRRLREENVISENKFFKMLSQIKDTYKLEKKKGGPIKPETKSKASRGETFFNLILDAFHNNQISFNQASSALDLNLHTLLREIR